MSKDKYDEDEIDRIESYLIDIGNFDILFDSDIRKLGIHGDKEYIMELMDTYYKESGEADISTDDELLHNNPKLTKDDIMLLKVFDMNNDERYKSKRVLSNVSGELRYDEEFVIEAIKRNAREIDGMPNTFLLNPRIIEAYNAKFISLLEQNHILSEDPKERDRQIKKIKQATERYLLEYPVQVPIIFQQSTVNALKSGTEEEKINASLTSIAEHSWAFDHLPPELKRYPKIISARDESKEREQNELLERKAELRKQMGLRIPGENGTKYYVISEASISYWQWIAKFNTETKEFYDEDRLPVFNYPELKIGQELRIDDNGEEIIGDIDPEILEIIEKRKKQEREEIKRIKEARRGKPIGPEGE